MINNRALVDQSSAQRFLCALDSSGIFSFQTFDDDKNRKNQSLARVLHGTFDEHAAALADLNRRGAGVFVMVNQGDLKGRTATNVNKVRALFVDLDGAPLAPVMNCTMPPHIIADSSYGKHHAYWLVSDCQLSDFKKLQQLLAKKFSGDFSVNDLPRVMRLPGFLHCKGTPTLTTLRSIDSREPYTVAQLCHGLALNTIGQSVNADALSGIRIAPDPNEPCPEGQRNTRLASLVGRWIVEGKTYSELIAVASHWNQHYCSPPLDDAEVIGVCTSILQLHGKNHSQPQQVLTTVSANPEGWEEPILFTEYATPDIPAWILPGVFAQFAAAVSTATETPEAMSVFAVLGTLSATLAKRFAVSPIPGWIEPLNIYTIVALPPANNKSLVLNRCTTPLREWEIEQSFLLDSDLKRQRSERRNQEKLIESHRTKAVRAKDPVERARLFLEINDLEANLPQIKSLPQLFANDATPESLAQNVHEQCGRFAIISDEGGITETLSGLYTGGTANIDLILKGIDGGDLRVRRRDRSFDLRPYLTFLLIVQPKIVQSMGERRAFQGNGLLERFLYVLPVSKLGYRTLTTPPVPDGIQITYGQAIRKLLDIQPIIDERGQEQPRILALSPDALSWFQQLRNQFEEELRPGGKFQNCTGWGGKLAGYSLRLAGLMHVAEHGERIKVISSDTMERAAYLSLLLIDHARAAFNLMGVDQTIEDAKAVLDWIKTCGKPVFRRTECLRALHGRFTKAARLTDALKVLADRNFVSSPESLLTTPGKRPTTAYRVNPMVLGAT